MVSEVLSRETEQSHWSRFVLFSSLNYGTAVKITTYCFQNPLGSNPAGPSQSYALPTDLVLILCTNGFGKVAYFSQMDIFSAPGYFDAFY